MPVTQHVKHLQNLFPRSPFSHFEMAVLKLITSAVMPALHILRNSVNARDLESVLYMDRMTAAVRIL